MRIKSKFKLRKCLYLLDLKLEPFYSRFNIYNINLNMNINQKIKSLFFVKRNLKYKINFDIIEYIVDELILTKTCKNKINLNQNIIDSINIEDNFIIEINNYKENITNE